MKTLVVFYSLDGNTEFVAGILANKLQADLVKLELEKPYAVEGFKKFFLLGMRAIFNSKPKLANENIDISHYDNIVIGTPVWAGLQSAPINSFIKQYKISGKKVALFVCSGGPDVDKCFAKMKKALSENDFVGEIDFVEPIKNGKDEATLKAEQWAQSLKF